MSAADEGVRLAKRVAALQGCSRSQAEAWIVAGAVRVNGQVVTDPARRVPEAVPVLVTDNAAHAELTVLLHKPAGVPAMEALHQAWAELAPGRALPGGLQACWSLPEPVSGLTVWSSERTVLRRLLDRERPLEVEWLMSLPMAEAEAVLARLKALGVRASLGHERGGMGQWRLVGKGDQALSWIGILDAGQLSGSASLRCQRLGRLGLSPLAPGQARLRLDFEKF